MDTLPPSLFIKNRSKLARLLLPSSVVVISSNRSMPRTADQVFPFRQTSDLFYLTGIAREGCTLVLYPCERKEKCRQILYIPLTDRRTAMWDGPGITPEEAKRVSGITDIRYSDSLIKDLREIIAQSSYIYFGEPLANNSVVPSNELEIRRELGSVLEHTEEHTLAPLLTRLRMFKEKEEIAMAQKAIEITREAFLSVLSGICPGMYEYEVAADISHTFLSAGCLDHAFPPIVASGRNSLVLHYISNRDRCMSGDLLLLDFGADWNYYAADISRTIPVNGRFTPRQRQVYDANIRVLEKSMRLMTGGKQMKEFNREVGLLWEEEHVKLGLYSMQDLREHSSNEPLWKKYYWHGTSHSIGIDVHDRFDQGTPFSAGMLLSCEPGIYIPEEGFGIRLENDILITDDGPVNLSQSIPIDPEEIEVMMGERG